VSDLLINLLASIIAGAAVWLAQRLVRIRRRAREQEFFGLSGGAACLLAVARHYASPHEGSVNRRDVAALVELASLARECGARADLATAAELTTEFGRLTEFCVGGPSTNPRTAGHLRTLLTGVTFSPLPDATVPDTITVGGRQYLRKPGAAEYVVLARAFGPAGGKPVFVLAGQTAASNLAAARYLSRNHRSLRRTYRADRPFCLILRVLEPSLYGTDFTEPAADLTKDAFTRAATRDEPAADTTASPPAPSGTPGEPAADITADPPTPSGTPGEPAADITAAAPGRSGTRGRTESMDILVAGGHGQIALQLLKILADQGHRARGLIRRPDQAADLEAVGAIPVIGDLENDESLADHVRGADAVVFAAGAGPGSGDARKKTVDLGGAVKLADAAKAEGVRRYVIVSSIGAQDPTSLGGSMTAYLEAKAAADEYVQASGLDWTVVRPGSLTNDPGTGRVRVNRDLGERGPIPRADVAAVLAACLTTPATIGQTFELFTGDTPIAEALDF
jgi:uncharacterized protein YbjT (DUF2867 family)